MGYVGDVDELDVYSHGQPNKIYYGYVPSYSVNDIIEFKIDAGASADLSQGAGELFKAVSVGSNANKVTELDIAVGWKGILIGYDTDGGAAAGANAYIFQGNDSNKDGYLSTSETTLVAKVVGVGLGNLNYTNFDFA